MLVKVRQLWKALVEEQIGIYTHELLGDKVVLAPLAVQTPPKPEMGDIAFPLFAYAKLLGMAAPKLASELKLRLEKLSNLPLGDIIVAGPYLNIRIDMSALARELSNEISVQKDAYGTNATMEGKRVTVEFSCPNTNKPLHLGHMRNDSIGQSISAILKANGAEVRKVNLINNRGVHICKSMLAYQKFGNGETPASTGLRG